MGLVFRVELLLEFLYVVYKFVKIKIPTILKRVSFAVVGQEEYMLPDVIGINTHLGEESCRRWAASPPCLHPFHPGP